MTREEVQPAWEKTVDIGFSDYEKLTREQRVWFNVEALATDGLWDHYMNQWADKNSDTIDDLEYLNFTSIANQLRAFMRFTSQMEFQKDLMLDKMNLINSLKTNSKMKFKKWTTNFGRNQII